MIKEDIPCLRLAYLPQLMVETLNETAIYHIKILAQHERAPNMFYKTLNIQLNNQRSMHGNDENILCWSQFKLKITFQLQFLHWNIFFSYFIYNFGKKSI